MVGTNSAGIFGRKRNLDRGMQRETLWGRHGKALLLCQGEAPEKPALPTCLRLPDTKTKRKPSSVF